MNDAQILRNLESLFEKFTRSGDQDNALKTMQEIIKLKSQSEGKIPTNNSSVLLG